MGLLRKLAKETAVYGLSTILGRLINYLLIILYTGVFAVGEYGKYSLVYAWVTFFNVIYTYGMETAYFRFASRDPEQKQNVFNTSLGAVIITSSVITILFLPFSGTIADYFGYSEKEVIVWVVLTLAVDAVCALLFARLRLEGKAYLFAGVKVFNILLNVGLNIFFMVLCPKAYRGEAYTFLKPIADAIYNPSLGSGYIFLSNLIANALQFLLLWPAWKKFRFSLQIKLFRSLFKYAWPLIFVGLAAMINEVFDRVMLPKLLPTNFYPGKTGMDVLGIYSACYKLSIFMTLAVQSFRFAGEPFFFSNANKENSPELFARVMHWFVIVCALIFLAVALNLDIISQIFLRKLEYREGLGVVPILLLANLSLGIYYNLSVWYKLTDKTSYGTVISLIGAAITIVLNIILIPVMGYYGSAWATFACYFSMAVLSYLWGQKYFRVPYRVLEALGLTVAAFLLYKMGEYLCTQDIIINQLIRIFILTLFIIFAIALSKISDKKKSVI